MGGWVGACVRACARVCVCVCVCVIREKQKATTTKARAHVHRATFSGSEVPSTRHCSVSERIEFRVQCYLTFTQTVHTIRDGEPRTATATLTHLLRSEWIDWALAFKTKIEQPIQFRACVLRLSWGGAWCLSNKYYSQTHCQDSAYRYWQMFILKYKRRIYMLTSAITLRIFNLSEPITTYNELSLHLIIRLRKIPLLWKILHQSWHSRSRSGEKWTCCVSLFFYCWQNSVIML